MDFFEAIKARASVRSFGPCEITDEQLEQVIDAGRRAPSGYNRQPCSFIVVRDKAQIEKLGRIQGCIAEATAAIAVVVDSGATQYWREDAAAAIENMLLAATAMGYASLWVEGYVLAKRSRRRRNPWPRSRIVTAMESRGGVDPPRRRRGPYTVRVGQRGRKRA